MRRIQLWQWVAIAGLALSAIRATSATTPWAPMDPLMTGTAAVASLVAAARLRGLRRGPWLIFGIIQVSTTIYGVLIVTGGVGWAPGSYAPLYGLNYALILTGFIGLLRSFGRLDLDSWLDALILAMAVAVLAWDFLLGPAGLPADSEMLAIVAGVVDILVLVGIARLLIRPVGPPSYRALLVTVGLAILLDAARYLKGDRVAWLDQVVAVGFVMGYGAWAALALHPATYRTVPAASAEARDIGRSAGFLGVLALVMAAPSLVLSRSLEAGGRQAGPILVAGLATLGGLMFIRAVRMLHRLERDVTERRAAEGAANEARLGAEEREKLVGALIDQSPAGIHVFAPDGTTLAFNEAFSRLIGAGDHPPTVDPYNVLLDRLSVANGLSERVRPAFAGTAVTFGPQRYQFCWPGESWSVDRPPIHLWVTFFPVKRLDGTITRVIGFFSDATAEAEAAAAAKRLEEQLRETQKLEALGVLAGGIAHDFNNLLVGILGNVGIARAAIPPESAAAADLAHAEAAAQRAADLASQMLAYSGRGSFMVSTTRLDALVRDMAGLLQRSISKAASLDLDLAEDVWVTGDVTQLRQVVLNLIMNASDALGGTGTIRVSTGVGQLGVADPDVVAGSETHSGPSAVLAVRDSGAGMDRETLGRAFEPFFTTKGAGRGLGLATTLGIVRGQHGALRVRSAPGLGSTFEVFLPLVAAPRADDPTVALAPGAAGDSEGGPSTAPGDATLAAPATAGVGAAAAEGRAGAVRRPGGRILLVDDEAGVRRLARRVLEQAGYEVVETADGAGALQTFAADPSGFALALLDITLPGMSGMEVLGRLRGVRPDLPVVLSSGWSGDEVNAMLGDHGDARFVGKPYRPADLVAAIDRALRREGASTR